MPFINYGDFLYGLFMVKIELLLQFAMCVLWVSGALAYASDLRGYENCEFDGYYHYPRPDDYNHVCDLINWAVPLAYATFGVQVLLWFFETSFGLYTFLLLDQESFNEPHFTWGRRAYDWKHSGLSHSGSGGANTYRARAVAAGAGAGAVGAGAGAAAAGNNATYSPGGNGGGGRRGAGYHDPESNFDGEKSDYYNNNNDVPETELMEEEQDDAGSSDRSSRLALGRRGRRGYADEEAGSEGGRAYSDRNAAESEGWHLRDQ